MFTQGTSRTQISKQLSVSRRLVNEWVQLYLSEGIEALTIKKSPGRPPALNTEQKQCVREFVLKHAVKEDGGRLIAEDVRLFMASELDTTYTLSNTYRLLHELKLSWITSRSRHPKQSEETQEAFKKFPT